ncbi:ABC transporter permease [Desulfosporosinus burensis]
MLKTIWLGIAFIVLLMFLASVAPLLTPADPFQVDMKERLQGISWQHPMGTDQLGRDLLSRVIYAARTSITATFSVVLACLAIGTVVGAVAGYYGGIIDELLMRLADVVMAFPSFILPIAITGILGPSLANIILALILTSWVGYARMVRSSVLVLKNLPYVEAAQAMGFSTWEIMKDHILPNAVHPVIVYTTFKAGHTILAICGLSFIGLGAQPPTPEWGSMLNEASSFMGSAPHLFIFPGLMIMITVLGFNLFGDGLRDFMDPRLRKEIEL